jgi:hypothetical protein
MPRPHELRPFCEPQSSSFFGGFRVGFIVAFPNVGQKQVEFGGGSGADLGQHAGQIALGIDVVSFALTSSKETLQLEASREKKECAVGGTLTMSLLGRNHRGQLRGRKRVTLMAPSDACCQFLESY